MSQEDSSDNSLKMYSPDVVAENLSWVAERFPGCITETQNEEGELVRAVDFDLLKQELSTEIVEGPQERYHLNWPGKREALLAANAPIAKTLRPCREASVDFDTTRHLFIEGDNLESLKLIQETYLNSVKLIYIDPPYNTGSDFVYRDTFRERQSEYLLTSSQIDESANQLVANKESNGRFHSEWLSMMYARLRTARTLLAQDGFIFISIDNNEVHNLKALCSEVFGQENFRNMIVVRRGVKNVQSQFEDISDLASGHEYLLCYSRDPSTRMPKLSHISEDNHAGKWDTFWRGTDRPTMRYELFEQTPETGQWRWSKEKAQKAQSNYKYYQSLDESKLSLDDYYLEHLQATNEKLDFVRLNEDQVVQYFVPPRDYKLISDNWMDITIKGSYIGFDTEKHVKYLRRIIDWITTGDDLVLDFFGGSGSTGHAVYEGNAELGRNNRCITIQIAEPAADKDYEHLANLTKQRLRKAAVEVGQAFGEIGLDLGFRTLRVDSSNMKDVYYHPDKAIPDLLAGHVDNIKDDRTDEDLLFQVLMDWGVDLTLPIAKEEIAGKEVFFIDTNALAACFSDGIDEEFVKELAKREPLRVVFRDAGYGGDDVKINVEQIFKQLSPSTEVKTI